MNARKIFLWLVLLAAPAMAQTPVAVSRGGTGRTTITSGNLMWGAGQSPVGLTAKLTWNNSTFVLGVQGTVNIASGSPLSWNSDSGFSRTGAAAVSFGNGTQGDASGTLTAATFVGDVTGTASTATAANGLKSATTTVAVSAATAPTNGQVLTATAGTTATWQTPASPLSGLTTNTIPVATSATAIGNSGNEAASDVAPVVPILQGQSAWSQATSNTTGGDLNLAGGLGRRFYTVVLNTGFSTKTITLTPNGGSAVVLTAGTDFTLGTDDTAPQLAVTATNMAAAINANGTLGPLMTATASTHFVYIDKNPTLYSLTIATNAGGTICTATSGADGMVTANKYGIGGVLFMHNYADTTSDGLNTFIGTGAGNVTMGPAGGASLLASENVVIGHNALHANTTGYQNAAIGNYALVLNTTGAGNQAIGESALGQETTGGNNVAVGGLALYGVTAGPAYNTALGFNAGRSITGAASFNTFLGGDAGYNASQLSSASNSTALGTNAYTTASNQVQLGDPTVTQVRTYGAYTVHTANAAEAADWFTSELITLNTGGTSTASSTNLIPANATIQAITYRVTTTIATATAFTINPTSISAFNSIGTATSSQTGLTANTTGVLVPAAFGDQYNSAANTVTITTTGTPSAGVIRVTVFYHQFTPPGS